MHHWLPYYIVPVMVVSGLVAAAALFLTTIQLNTATIVIGLVGFLVFSASTFTFVAVWAGGNFMQMHRRSTRAHLYVPVQAEVTRLSRRTGRNRNTGRWVRWAVCVKYEWKHRNIRHSFVISDAELAAKTEKTRSIAITIDPDYPYELRIPEDEDNKTQAT